MAPHEPNPKTAAAADFGRQLVEFARSVVWSELIASPIAPPDHLVRAFPKPAGVFVTIRLRSGELRGCVGTQHPVCDCVAEELVRVAPLAAFADHRFPPVQVDEFDQLVFEVSVLKPARRVSDLSKLDPSRFGISIRDAEGRRALLLPSIPSITTVRRQLKEARHKAGIGPDDPIEIWRFEVVKFSQA